MKLVRCIQNTIFDLVKKGEEFYATNTPRNFPGMYLIAMPSENSPTGFTGRRVPRADFEVLDEDVKDVWIDLDSIIGYYGDFPDDIFYTSSLSPKQKEEKQLKYIDDRIAYVEIELAKEKLNNLQDERQQYLNNLK